jgi:hypothetical protein
MQEQHRAMIIQWLVWGAAGAFLFVLALRDVQLDRTLEVAVERFDRATSYLSTFGPNARVERTRDAVRITGEPVYVTLRMPRWFREVVVEIAYENPTELPEVEIGPRTHPTSWQFDLRSLEDRRDAYGPDESGAEVVVRQFGNLIRAQVPFTLHRNWQVERNVYQFLVSVSGASPERPIIIRSLRVTAKREPICIGRLCL